MSGNARAVRTLSSSNKRLTPAYSLLIANITSDEHIQRITFVNPCITNLCLLHLHTVSLPDVLVCVLFPVTIAKVFLNFVSLSDHMQPLAYLKCLIVMMALLSDTTVSAFNY